MGALGSVGRPTRTATAIPVSASWAQKAGLEGHSALYTRAQALFREPCYGARGRQLAQSVGQTQSH
jgi:hypothetical protein